MSRLGSAAPETEKQIQVAEAESRGPLRSDSRDCSSHQAVNPGLPGSLSGLALPRVPQPRTNFLGKCVAASNGGNLPQGLGTVGTARTLALSAAPFALPSTAE